MSEERNNQNDKIDNANESEINYSPSHSTNQASQEVFSLSGSIMNYLIVAAVFLGVGVLLGVNLGGGGGVDAGEVRVIVNEVVSEEVRGLQEAITTIAAAGGGVDSEALAALVQSAVEDAVADQVDYMADDDPYRGPEDAPVVMVEFSDFLCGFCGRHYQQTLTPLLENYDGYVRYVYRDFPGVGGQNAIESALAAECANDQVQFWNYHELLFDNQQSLGTNNIDALHDVLRGFAQQVELDMETFDACLNDRNHVADIIQDTSDAQSIGARGTPAFLINGTFISGAQPYEVFAALIEDELAKAGIDLEDET